MLISEKTTEFIYLFIYIFIYLFTYLFFESNEAYPIVRQLEKITVKKKKKKKPANESSEMREKQMLGP